jgi:hypothetical protein
MNLKLPVLSYFYLSHTFTYVLNTIMGVGEKSFL